MISSVASRHPDNELTVAITSLSIGGAERIVLDWAERIHPRWRVHLIVLRDCEKEWSVPAFVRVTRLQSLERSISPKVNGEAAARRLQLLGVLGREIAQSKIPVCVCHLLGKAERDALASGGAAIVPVLHNARDGWGEDASALAGSANVVAVSAACADDLRRSGWRGPVTVVRHIPFRRIAAADAREQCRRAWNVPQDATVIGMVGAVKAQKNYVRALHILKLLHERRDAYLVILGGPVNAREGRTAWETVIREVHCLGLRSRVAMPGFVPDAAAQLPAFDAVLNTSSFEGLSIATLEALLHGMPVVASRIGGQGELAAEGLTLLPVGAPDSTWAASLAQALGRTCSPPPWANFPSYRLWTLVGLARPFVPSSKTLFVTANLNSGGAQRSLVNLAASLAGELDFEVAVAGNSTEGYFHNRLIAAGVDVSRVAESSEAFVNAEMLVHKICTGKIGTVCYWNVDPKVKLLVTKALAHTGVKFLDVSPGAYSFEEMAACAEFGEHVAYSGQDYYRALNTLVLKYDGVHPATCRGKTVVIRNGVPPALREKTDYALHGPPRVAVSGRIAPTKFLREIVQAVRLLRQKLPDTQLHIFGGAEPQHQAYAEEVLKEGKMLAGGACFHGTNFDVVQELRDFDAYVVLGMNQGCPNALLEALSVGMPVVANDDGGTREQVIPGKTGLLIDTCSPQLLADALHVLLTDRVLAGDLGRAGRQHVRISFSMNEMTQRYLRLLACESHADARPARDGDAAEPKLWDVQKESAECPSV